MTRFHGCLSWSYDATAALGHEFAGAGLGYQWLPRSEAAGRFRTSDLAGHRPIRDIRAAETLAASPVTDVQRGAPCALLGEFAGSNPQQGVSRAEPNDAGQ